MITARADVVGSLLRPPELLAAQRELAAGAIGPARFKAVEDRAVDQAIELQEAAGLEVLTDGELRRLSFQSQMTSAVEGFGAWDLDTFLWGEWHGGRPEERWSRPRPAGLGAVSPLRWKRSLSAEEFTYLRARTRRTPKLTLPSPGLFAEFWSPELSRAAYPTQESLLADVVVLLRQEIAELVRLGAKYLQLDAPHYGLLVDSAARALYYDDAGWDPERWLRRCIELDNAVMEGFSGVVFGVHVCRGNQAGRWLAQGGYEPVARTLFRGLRAQRLLLEYDDVRSGSFAPLAEVPEDKLVVLGLVTTKSPRPETAAELIERVREASRYVPLERLAISPQCGFASSVLGNRISAEDQRRKLEVLVEAALQLWGTA
jgi:5-methyltetrahydropteroyltriglutamate--homocysteine methyltransferase